MVTLTIRIPSVEGKPEWTRSFEVSAPPPPVICREGEERTKTCPDGTVIVTERCERDPVSGLTRWVPTGAVCPPPVICREGEERTKYCPDTGTTIVTERCERDPVTGLTRWVPTGNVCPPKPICIEGEERTKTCPDGTVIVTERCERDPVSGLTRWVPTGAVCPPVAVAKVVQILAAGERLTAWEGQEISIAASVMCGLTPSSGEEAILTIDGVEVERKRTSEGMVEYKWKASAEPTRFRKICVTVPVSAICPKYSQGRDCKTISVSREVPSIYEQLRKEREAYAERIAAIRRERERIRELPIAPAVAVPWAPVITPPIEVVPPITPPVVPPVTPPSMGWIMIPDVPKPPGWPYNIEIYIDGENLGAPPISRTVTPGKHTLEVKLRGFAPISRTITVAEGQTITITDIMFG